MIQRSGVDVLEMLTESEKRLDGDRLFYSRKPHPLGGVRVGGWAE
jgi:hypothetical protein